MRGFALAGVEKPTGKLVGRDASFRFLSLCLSLGLFQQCFFLFFVRFPFLFLLFPSLTLDFILCRAAARV